MKVNLVISIKQDTPKPKSKDLAKCLRDHIKTIDEQGDSAPASWNYIRRLWNKIEKKPKHDDHDLALLSMMEDVVMKYHKLDPKGVNVTSEIMSELNKRNG